MLYAKGLQGLKPLKWWFPGFSPCILFLVCHNVTFPRLSDSK